MEESHRITIGPRGKEEEQYLISKGHLFEDSNGEYRDMSTIIDVSDEESFSEKRSYSLPYVGIENINSGEFNYDSCDDKENVQPPLPSDNSYNEQIEKNLMDSSLLKSHQVFENEGAVRSHHTVMEECNVEVQQGMLEKVTEHHETQEIYPVEAQPLQEVEIEYSGEVPSPQKITVKYSAEVTAPEPQKVMVECSVEVPTLQEIAVECSVVVPVPAHQEIAFESSVDVPAHQEIAFESSVKVPAHQEITFESSVEVPAHQEITLESSVDVPARQEMQEECAAEVVMHQKINEKCVIIETHIRQDEASVHEVILEGPKSNIEIEQAKPDVTESELGILEENLEFEVSSMSISGVNNRSFTISVHEPDANEMSNLALPGYEQIVSEECSNETRDEIILREGCNGNALNEQLKKASDKVQQFQEENAEVVENSILSTSEINNRSFTISVHDSDAFETSGKSGSSGDMDDTMTAIEKLLALAAEQEESEINAEQSSIFETSVPLRSSQFPANSSNLIELESVAIIDQDNLMETPVEPFLQGKVTASSTGSRHIETPKSRENRSGRKKSENLMYFSPAPPLVPKRILDLKKKGKFFSPSPPRPLPNALPPRGVRPVKEEVQNENLLTPVQYCGRVLRNASSDKKEKKKIHSVNNLYADVNSPVKEYIYGRATPASLLKSKSTNVIRSLPVPQQKPGQGFRQSGISSITRIPKPKLSISSNSKLSIGRTSNIKGDLVEISNHPQSGIPKPSAINKFKNDAVVFEGSLKQRVRNNNDDTLSTSQISEAALRHTGLRNESGNASLLLGNPLMKKFYPTTPSKTPISTNAGKRNV